MTSGSTSLIIKKEMGLEEVKKELQEIRHHIADCDVETDSVQCKSKPDLKGQNATR